MALIGTAGQQHAVNDKQEVREFVEEILGAKGIAAIEKQLKIERPEIPQFSDRAGYEKALEHANKLAQASFKGKSFACPSSTGKNPSSITTWQDLSDAVWGWGSDYADNTIETIAYLLGEANTRRRKIISGDVYAGINKRAEALDDKAKGKLQKLLVLLRHVLVLEKGTAYATDETRMLRHLTKAREDVMDLYLPFFASVQPVLNRVDSGNVQFTQAVQAVQGKKLEDILAEIKSLSIHGSITDGLEIPVAVQAQGVIPDYIKAKCTHEGVRFFTVVKVGPEHQDSTGFDIGLREIDCTEKAVRILNTLLKG